MSSAASGNASEVKHTDDFVQHFKNSHCFARLHTTHGMFVKGVGAQFLLVWSRIPTDKELIVSIHQMNTVFSATWRQLLGELESGTAKEYNTASDISDCDICIKLLFDRLRDDIAFNRTEFRFEC